MGGEQGMSLAVQMAEHIIRHKASVRATAKALGYQHHGSVVELVNPLIWAIMGGKTPLPLRSKRLTQLFLLVGELWTSKRDPKGTRTLIQSMLAALQNAVEIGPDDLLPEDFLHAIRDARQISVGEAAEWVTNKEEVIANIIRYNDGLAEYYTAAVPQVRTANHFVQWGDLIAPSKFIAYKDMTWPQFLALNKHGMVSGPKAKSHLQKEFTWEERNDETPEFTAWLLRHGLVNKPPRQEQTLVIWFVPQEAATRSEQSEDAQLHVRPRNSAVVHLPVRDSAFRRVVLAAYGHQCAVCNIAAEELLEAAHIEPVTETADDSVSNGLCLCVLHHRAYDVGLLTITPQGHLRVSDGVELKLDRDTLRLPQLNIHYPATHKLAKHVARSPQA